MDKKAECNCLVRHVAPEERATVVQRLEYFRRIGDGLGMLLATTQLEKCPGLTR